ncbi:Transposase [Shigella dysenteriae 1617]|uniref:Transposase n=1 Tax=Shigella dysenteriae 1617 TaxID=754093 RepID=A0A0A6ZXF3_SHIDY|nr:Transposase [Shigella dysenteriae 1617]
MASVNIHCPRCQSAQVYRHGQNPKGHDRFRCRDCHRVFQLLLLVPRTDETCRVTTGTAYATSTSA